MQIHELNTFSGTLGSGTYLAVDNGTDTGKINTQFIPDTENAITDLKADLQSYKLNTVNMESGGFADATGAKSTNNKRIRTVKKIDISEYSYIRMPDGFSLLSYIFDASGTYLGYDNYRKYLIPQYHIPKKYAQGASFYIAIRKDSASSSDISGYVSQVESGSLFVKNIVGSKMLVGGEAIAANTDLDSILTTGNYYSPNKTTSETLGNCPTTSSFTMTVSFASGNDGDYLIQDIQDYYANEYKRTIHIASPIEATTWRRINASAPSLKPAERQAIVDLAVAYQTNRSLFYYDTTTTRNNYAGKSTLVVDGKCAIDCSTFAQLVWMGRSATDFNSPDDYSNSITKAFDWGYYFDFKNRGVYGLQPGPDSYYGFNNPLGSPTYENSYSFNSYYSANSNNPKKQVFNTYMYANDMAEELERLGCAIPVNELQAGDLVFTKVPVSAITNNFADIAYKGITHVAIVRSITDSQITFIESGSVSYPISSVGTSFNNDFDKCRATFLLNNIVMCARHPRAFNIGSNVPSAITTI